MAWYSSLAWCITPCGLAVCKSTFGWMMSCWTRAGRVDGKAGGSHSQVYIGKLVQLRRNKGNFAKDSDISREFTFEHGLPGRDLRLLYKSHQEGSSSQQNTTANRKIRRISIMRSASDILKPIIFCICKLLACSICSPFTWSQARDRLR